MSVERPVVHVIEMKVEPKTRADEAKMRAALNAMAQEDPTFGVMVDAESGEIILKGMGELHLDSKLDQLQRVYGVDSNCGAPQVAYRETLARQAEVRFSYQDKQRGDVATVGLRLEPADLDFENMLVSDLDDDPEWDRFVDGIKTGVRQVWEQGVLIGFPMVDMKVTLLNMLFYNDSSPNDFIAAARLAIREGCENAGVKLLEPVMAVEVVTPPEFIIEIRLDLDARRGRIQGMSMRDDLTVIQVLVPMSCLFGYASAVRLLGQGRVVHSMTFSHFADVPRHISGGGPENFPPAIGMRA